jgi:hypothetical protein
LTELAKGAKIMISRNPSAVKTSAAPSFDEPRFLNGIYRAHRLPSCFFENNENEKPNQQPSKEELEAKIKSEVEKLAAKYDGDLLKAAMTYYKDAFVQRERASEAEKNQLTPEINAELAKWRELGESPDKVKAAIDAGSEAIKTATDLKRKDVLADVREVLKVKKSPLFDKLTDGVEFKVAGEIKDGKDERAVLIVSDGKETPWDEFLKGRLDIAEALPALKTGTRWDKAPSGPQDKGQNPDLLKQGQQASYSTTQSAF